MTDGRIGKQMNVRFSRVTFKAVEEMAKESGRSRSEIIRTAVERYLGVEPTSTEERLSKVENALILLETRLDSISV